MENKENSAGLEFAKETADKLLTLYKTNDQITVSQDQENNVLVTKGTEKVKLSEDNLKALEYFINTLIILDNNG